MSRSPWPRDLAETLSDGVNPCPLPSTHDRLDECHYWWHGMARNYHEPKQFRWHLGAFVQAARNVTWMLQAEKDTFDDFSWYEERWRPEAAANPLLRWLNETRVHVTKRGPLSASSWALMTCLFDEEDPRRLAGDDEGAFAFSAPEQVCTHALLRSGPSENHPHEVERYWEIQDLPEIEALEACAMIVDELDGVVRLGHAELGAGMEMRNSDGPVAESGGHKYPCMNQTREARVVRTYMTDDGEEWVDDPTDPIH